MIYLAIVGSRNFTDREFFNQKLTEFVEKQSDEITVISGGARGVDTLAEKWANDQSYPIKVFPADWKQYGKSAGPRRNQQIVEVATHMIAFPSRSGKGTQDSMFRAETKGIPCTIHYID